MESWNTQSACNSQLSDGCGCLGWAFVGARSLGEQAGCDCFGWWTGVAYKAHLERNVQWSNRLGTAAYFNFSYLYTTAQMCQMCQMCQQALQNNLLGLLEVCIVASRQPKRNVPVAVWQ